jgi:iron complex transport system ATP-binding protein
MPRKIRGKIRRKIRRKIQLRIRLTMSQGDSVPAAPTLEAEGVSFAYAERDVLRSVSLAVAGGEVVGVLGPNGSGKTTLLRCLLGILRPRSGTILLDRRDIAAYSRNSFALRVAAVSQEMPTDFPLRVGELVLLGRLPHLPGAGLGFERPDDVAAAEAALEACGVADLAMRSIHEISGGELRRVFIARALCQAAPVLLLDEPTGGLDLRHQMAIVALLRRQARAGGAVLAVFHDLNLAAAACDRVVLLKAGSVVASGSPDTVLTPEILTDVYGVEVHVVAAADSGRRFLIPSVT